MTSMSQDVGVSQQSWSNYEKGQNEPKASFLKKLVKEYGISARWLLTGEGEMWAGDGPRAGAEEVATPEAPEADEATDDGATGDEATGDTAPQGADVPTGRVHGTVQAAGRVQRMEVPTVTHDGALTTEEVSAEGTAFVPVYDAPVGAGDGGNADLVHPSGLMAFRAEWLRRTLRIRPHRAFVAEVFGPSMRGVLESGDQVIGELVETVPRHDLCVVAYDGDLLVKHLVRTRSGVELRSEHPSYPTIAVEGGLPFVVIGVVRGRISLV